jgi:hypothetical protein
LLDGFLLSAQLSKNISKIDISFQVGGIQLQSLTAIIKGFIGFIELKAHNGEVCMSINKENF